VKAARDNFSIGSADYSRFRPDYPPALYDFIYAQCSSFDAALDCGTGNGQVATVLSKQFAKVCATDISQNQLEQAPTSPNIAYSLQRAEQTSFADASFDLITVGQAYHWFDFDAFTREATRLLRPGGIVAIWTYGLIRINEALTPLLDHFYRHVTGPYWDEERKWVDMKYQTIPFHFDEIETDFRFQITSHFNLSTLKGYLNTWSGIRHFIHQEGYNPVDQFIESLQPLWPATPLKVTFPGFIRIGKASSRSAS
jgi:ubiquinone/menaquinone biosynthesis C-methylase UbiE